MKMWLRSFVVLVFSLLVSGRVMAFEPIWPVACEIGKDCWVQNYIDVDPSKEAKDFACGGATYDGHDGVDIRVLDMKKTADVLAVADGVVKGTRDGVPDKLVRTETDLKSVAKIECGNGVVVAHGDGFETQYCHMKRGSIAVKKGARVSAGTKLGKVGASGAAAFPHLHLTVRKAGQKLDPFSVTGGDCAAEDKSIWPISVQQKLANKGPNILKFGIAAREIKLELLENGEVPAGLSPTAPAILAYVWVINLREGDEMTVTLEGPKGITATNTYTAERSKAQYMSFAGSKRTKDKKWPLGTYTVRTTVTGKDGLIVEGSQDWEMNEQ